MRESLAYFRGAFVPASNAVLPVYDAGFVQGATATQQIRTFGGRLFRLTAHVERLFATLEYLGIVIRETHSRLIEISEELVAHNRPLAGADAELGLIQFVTPGPQEAYSKACDPPPALGPTVCVHTFPLDLGRWVEPLRAGVMLKTVARRQVPAECWSPSYKIRSRLHYYLAEREARQANPLAWPLLLDFGGNVSESSIANVLVVKDGAIVSPPADSILPGISRATVLELAAALGIPTHERAVSIAQAQQSDELLLTSTPFCMLPAVTLDDRPIGGGYRGPVFEAILDAWSDLVGVDIEAQILAARTSG